MEPLKLLSIGAIALAVCACVLTFVLYKRTSGRLDALTQANLGVTHTLHRLIAASMPQQAQGHGQSAGQTSPQVQPAAMSQAERIVVSDDSESESETESDSDMDQDTDDGSDAGSESGSEHTIELGDPVTLARNDSSVHNIVVDSVLFATSGNKRFEEVVDDDASDNATDDASENDDDSECSTDEDEKIALDGDEVQIDADDINVEEQNKDENVDLVAFLLPQTDSNSIDIGIVPINANSSSLPDSFKQMKVDELRKLIVSKLGMSDDDAKKLKKPQLIQKLSESHG